MRTAPDDLARLRAEGWRLIGCKPDGYVWIRGRDRVVVAMDAPADAAKIADPPAVERRAAPPSLPGRS